MYVPRWMVFEGMCTWARAATQWARNAWRARILLSRIRQSWHPSQVRVGRLTLPEKHSSSSSQTKVKGRDWEWLLV